MDSLQDLLARRSPKEPSEIIAIKEYVRDHFDGRTVSVALTPHSFIITASSAAFAGALKSHIRQLQIAAHTEKLITLRIG